MYDLTLGLMQERPLPSDDVVIPRFRALRDAARANDPLLASDLQDMINGKNATEIGNARNIMLRRCVVGGHITQEQVAAFATAAKNVAQ